MYWAKFKILYVISFVLLLNKGAFAVDTINRIDENNMKQGHWVYTNKMKNLPNYRDDQVVEEGNYSDDKKTGKWMFYYNNDKVKHILTYTNNRPEGYAVFYYKNGNKREEGTWKNNKWVGDYKYYYKNGNIRNEWSYNQNGQRTGTQKYYYENGQLMIEGVWENGKEAGLITEYHEDGSVKSERKFLNGKIDIAATKNYKPQEKEGKVTIAKKEKLEEQPKEAISKTVTIRKAEAAKESPWNGTGDRQFLNKKGQVVREGYFENGYLMDGKVYMYTAEGKKFRTTVYKGGRKVKEINHLKKEN
jgi:antitoxin component YwqK of YwqJK toxin-antitoxin module